MNLPPVSKLAAVVAWFLATPVAAAGAPSPAPPAYEKEVLQLFRARCQGCHRPGQSEAGLDVSTRGDLLQGGVSGPAVVPGDPEGSRLYQLLRDGRMPKGGPRLAEGDLRRVARWIKAGAPGTSSAAGHWAFRPPVRPPVPVKSKVKSKKAKEGEAGDWGRVRNPIDAFLLARLERKGLTFSPEADPRTLIRRVTYDLTGLPPTPEEVEAFVAECEDERKRPVQNPKRERGAAAVLGTQVRDTGAPLPHGRGSEGLRQLSPYERLVDRLLASPAYGERWARHWLDPAGYADSEGVLQEDRVRPNAWRYRDYVVRSFNEDKPYDQFVREQIAGDELVEWRTAATFTPEMVETLTATGFLRTAVDGTRDDFNPHQYGEYQYRMLHDTQTIVASTVLGLTVQCARCHDHKYEPISHQDYYRLQALFTGAVRPRGTLLPSAKRQIVAGGVEEQERARKVNTENDAALAALAQREAALLVEYRTKFLDQQVEKVAEGDREALRAAIQLEVGKRTPAQKELVAKYKPIADVAPDALGTAIPGFRKKLDELNRARDEAKLLRANLPTLRAFYDQDAAPPPTPLLIRGDWLRPGEPVAPGIPAVLDDPARPFRLPAPGPATTYRRKALAEWLTRPEHPMTARVMVNRVWMHHFGQGLVPTPDNFGRSGARPTHPELLDWLAATFVEGGPHPNPSPKLGGGAGGGGHPWSLKSLHRLIITSAAYRQSSVRTNPQSAIGNPQLVDPENRLLWRQRGRRLEAEAIRDGMLAAAGTLDRTLYGEPVGMETKAGGEIVAAGEEKGGRRSLYLLVRRTQPLHLLNVFDAPVMETNCTRRATSTTATQALALINGTFMAAQSRHFARRVLKERPAAGADAGAVDYGYALAFARLPTPVERQATLRFLEEQIARYRKDPPRAATAVEEAYGDFAQALLSTNEFIYVD